MTVDTYVLLGERLDRIVLKNGSIMTMPEVVAELNRLSAALGALPNGCLAVPSKITTEMMTAAYVAAEERGSRVSSVMIGVIYSAAVEAAPALRQEVPPCAEH
ncbi:hypothetical protein IPC264_26170 [Pseudomonas aeruginosa]|uniref:hypothetical protein n=1 Tax=Pseudomonas aeruginosa TaxID=287 RepID=UPI000F51B88F|nr:hypothetical protein [Pseudomonas aeruginosa]RQF48527.1 hypothetical protein IPC264_26170 [Pseudomonas aeruginosa]